MSHTSNAVRNAPGTVAVTVMMVVLLFGSATFYSGPGPVGGAGPSAERWGTALAWMGRALTLPLDTPGAADVRGVLLPLIAGGAWLWFAIRRHHVGIIENGGAWFECLGVALIAGAMLSAWSNGSLDYSTGWIVTLAAGIAWAACLRRAATSDTVPTLVTTALICAATVCGLSLWYRQQMGLLFFGWPIGALTPTAAVASLATATGACWLAAATAMRVLSRGHSTSHKPRFFFTTMSLVSLLLAGGTLWLTDRRAPLIGAVVGIAIALMFFAAVHRPSRRLWRSLIFLALIFTVGGGAWLYSQLTSTKREVSGSVHFRFLYWRESLDLIRAAPLLGHGPESFARVMTPRLALRRAENPHVFEGNFDPEAHNEWLQAAVELGIPLALLYLALPIGVVGLAVRRAIRTGDLQPATLALMGGIVAVVVNESASTSLRHFILPAWYWTWIGLLIALQSRQRKRPAHCASEHTEPVACAGGSERWLRVIVSPVLGLVLLAAGLLDLYRMDAHAAANAALRNGEPPDVVLSHLSAARGRFGFTNWLAVESMPAEVLDQLAQRAAESFSSSAPATHPAIARSIDAWRALAERFPGMADYEVRLAQAFQRAGWINEADTWAEKYLHHVNPYDVAANLLAARNMEEDDGGRWQCVAAAIRSGSLDRDLEELLDRYFARPENLAHWLRNVVPTLNRAIPTDNRSDSPLPEWHRIDAYRQRRAGDLVAAIHSQQLAADIYRKLYETNSTYRRRHDAEWDAWLTLADMLFALDSADAARACDAVEWAERFALLGYGHENLRVSVVNPDFFGDEVVPTDTPEHLRPLWRLSAKLRMAAGRERHLLLRVLLSLPPDRQTVDDANAEASRIAAELVEVFERLPAERRPANYAGLRRMAEGAR